MEYVFGSTFVCKTTDAAKEVSLSLEFSSICGIAAASAFLSCEMLLTRTLTLYVDYVGGVYVF